MVAGCRVLHSSATGAAQPQRLRASPPRQDQNHRASGLELPGFVPNPRDKGSRAIHVSARWNARHEEDLSKPATPNQFGKTGDPSRCQGSCHRSDATSYRDSRLAEYHSVCDSTHCAWKTAKGKSSSMLQARSLEVEHRLAKTVRTPAP